MDLNIRGRSALITGASKGIGLAISMVLADEGCNLILVSRTAADLHAAKENLRKTGVSVMTPALDVSSSASIDKLATAYPDIDTWSTMRALFPPVASTRSMTSAGAKRGT